MEWSVQIPENKLGINLTSKIVSIGNKPFSFDYDESSLDADLWAYRVHFFDYEKNKWFKIRYYDGQNYDDVPRASSRGFNVVSWDKYAYLWGGYNTFQFAEFGEYFDTLYRFNSVTGIWDRPEVFGVIPEGKEYHISAVVNGKMYLIGANYEEPMEFYCLDLETYIWTFIENEHPQYYCSSDCFVVKKRYIYFSAGSDDMFDGTQTGTWTQYFGCFDTKNHSLTYETASTNDLYGRYISKGFSHNDLIFIFTGNRRDFFFTRYLYKFNTVSKDLKKIQVPSKKLHIRGIVQKGFKVHFFVDGKIPKKLLGKEELAKLSHPTQINEGDFILTLDLAFDLKSLCIEKVASYKLDISELPKVLQKEIEEF